MGWSKDTHFGSKKERMEAKGNECLLTDEDLELLAKMHPDLDISFVDDYRKEVAVLYEAQHAKTMKIQEPLIRKDERERLLRIAKAVHDYDNFVKALGGEQEGIRKVVEWVKSHNDFTRLDICCEKHGVLLTEAEWQAQLRIWFKDNPELLKEWGIE